MSVVILVAVVLVVMAASVASLATRRRRVKTGLQSQANRRGAVVIGFVLTAAAIGTVSVAASSAVSSSAAARSAGAAMSSGAAEPDDRGTSQTGGTRDPVETSKPVETSSSTSSSTIPPAEVVTNSGPGEYTVEFTHPSLGRMRLVTKRNGAEGTQSGPASITVTDRFGVVRYSYSIDLLYELAPARLRPDPTAEGPMDPVDSTGNVFIDYNPGRYNGVIVLRPTEIGFDDLGTAWADTGTRFYSAVIVDRDGDGQFEIEQATNDCEPSCGEGTTTVKVFRWNGTDYAASAPAMSTQVSVNGMGPFVLGMSRLDIGKMGFELSKPGCGTLRRIKAGGREVFTVFESDEKVVALAVADPAWTAPSGIRVGSSVADLEQAYGANLKASSFEGNIGPVPAWVLRSPESVAAGRFLWFTMSSGVVDRITLVGGSTTPSALLC